MSSRAPHPSRVGEQLGSLRLLRLVGEGGMGAVYEARHLNWGRCHAVKILHPELARDPQMYARFFREAQIAASLESAHIVPVRKFGNAADGTPYLVMEFLEGEDLGTILKREAPLAAFRAVDLMLQACRGLRVAHEHEPGIVHRDLKPENLFICPRNDGTELLKILDFGIAKLLEPKSAATVTCTGGVIGTPHYMSPEQAEGLKAIDQRTDIYALGAILYETLSGRKAHPGSSYNEIISHILLKPLVPLESQRDDLPPALLSVVRRALETKVAERYQTIAQLEVELGACLRDCATTTRSARCVKALRTVRPPQDPESPTLAPSFDTTGSRAAQDPEAEVVGRRTPDRHPVVGSDAEDEPRIPLHSLGLGDFRIWAAAGLLLGVGLLSYLHPWLPSRLVKSGLMSRNSVQAVPTNQAAPRTPAASAPVLSERPSVNQAVIQPAPTATGMARPSPVRSPFKPVRRTGPVTPRDSRERDYSPIPDLRPPPPPPIDSTVPR